MFELTPADVAAAKAASMKKHGHERLTGIDYRDPVSGNLLTTVLFADLDLAAASDYYDARLSGIAPARAALFQERAMFPDVDALETIREAWAEFDRSVENELRMEWGYVAGAPSTKPLSASCAAPGFEKLDVAALIAANPGARLWTVSRPSTGLACVLRQPMAAVYHMTFATLQEAFSTKRGPLLARLGVIEDHCAWAPGASLRAHLVERPGRLDDIGDAWQTMGGAAAKTSARRF